jgi:hypothetical protein
MATDRDGGTFPKLVAIACLPELAFSDFRARLHLVGQSHESGSGGMDLHASNPCIDITCIEVTIYELSKMLPVQKLYKPSR